jgi:hypothetical protein
MPNFSGTYRCWLFLRVVIFIATTALGSMLLLAQDNKPLRPDDSSSLRWHAREAEKLGETSISIPAPNFEVAQPESLNDALAHTTLVLARFLAQATTHDDDFVVTWRKYRILEKFSSPPIVSQDSDEPFTTYVPASLLPISQSEFVMAEIGGTAVIDGVTITMRNSENRALPEAKPVLMFLQFASSGAIAALNYGTIGAFWTDQFETIHAIDESDDYHLGSELLHRSAGKLSGVRALANFRGQLR